MNMLKVDDLSIGYHQADLNGKVAISLNIGAGFALRRAEVDGEEILLGSTAAKVYVNYVKARMNELYDIPVASSTTMNSMSLYWESDPEHYKKEIQQLLNELFLIPIDWERLMQEKKDTMERYQENYKNLEFRGRMKMLEFTNANKNFEMNQLSSDLMGLNKEQIELLRSHLCFADNMFLFVHGDGTAAELEQLTVPNHEKKDVQGIYSLSNWQYEQDVTLKKASKGSYQCGAIKFERHPTNIDLSIEHAVLSIIGEVLFNGRYEVHVDRVDAAITYFETSLKEYKQDAYACLTDESIDAGKFAIAEKINRMVSSQPKQFVLMAGKMYFDRVDIYQWMAAIQQMHPEQIKFFLQERDYKIREGYLNYYKGENRYVG